LENSFSFLPLWKTFSLFSPFGKLFLFFPLLERGIKGDLMKMSFFFIKSPLTPLFQRGETRGVFAKENNIEKEFD